MSHCDFVATLDPDRTLERFNNFILVPYEVNNTLSPRIQETVLLFLDALLTLSYRLPGTITTVELVSIHAGSE